VAVGRGGPDFSYYKTSSTNLNYQPTGNFNIFFINKNLIFTVKLTLGSAPLLLGGVAEGRGGPDYLFIKHPLIT